MLSQAVRSVLLLKNLKLTLKAGLQPFSFVDLIDSRLSWS